MPITRSLTQSLLFLVLAIIAVTEFSGCKREEKIQLPDRCEVSGSPDNLPVIEIQNVDLIGNTDKSTIVSTTAATPEQVLVTPDSDDLAKIVLIGVARDNTLGIRYFRIRVAGGSQVLSEAIANQFPDVQNMVYPSHSIIGTDGSGNAGVTLAIQFWSTKDSDIIVTSLAMNFGWIIKSMEIHYACPECYSTAGWPGGTPSPVGGTTSGGSGSSTQREQGAFVEVDPDVRVVGQTLHSPNGAFSAAVEVNSLGAEPQLVRLKTGTKIYALPFAVGSISAFLPQIGGAEVRVEAI